MPDGMWQAMVNRVRGEFDEMPCLRVTPDQARVLFGLSADTSDWILNRLVQDGFLVQTPEGQYVRRSTVP
jgi:hypothetical protein